MRWITGDEHSATFRANARAFFPRVATKIFIVNIAERCLRERAPRFARR